MEKEAEEKLKQLNENIRRKEELLNPKISRFQGWDYFFNEAFYSSNPKTRVQRSFLIFYFAVLSLILLVFFQEKSILIMILVRLLGAVGLIFTLYSLFKELWQKKSH